VHVYETSVSTKAIKDYAAVPPLAFYTVRIDGVVGVDIPTMKWKTLELSGCFHHAVEVQNLSGIFHPWSVKWETVKSRWIFQP
jgi:hypothetical protein